MSRYWSLRPLWVGIVTGHLAALLAVGTLIIGTAGVSSADPLEAGQALVFQEAPALAFVVPAQWQGRYRTRPVATADRCRRRYRVGVIDMFYPGDHAFASEEERTRQFQVRDAVDVDGDGRRDPYYHGDIVSLFATDPAIEIVPYNVGNLTTAKAQIARHLATIEEQVARGDRLDAILLAWESSTLIRSLDDEIRVERAAAYREKLRQWRDESDTWRWSYEVVARLERLAASGVAVYTIAGNTGPRMINLYTLGEGVTAVGAEERDLEGDWVCRNAFVDTVAPAVYRVRLVAGAVGEPSGYDLNGDNIPDIPVGRVSSAFGGPSQPARPTGALLQGSSYAAATAVKRHFAQAAAQCGEPVAAR